MAQYYISYVCLFIKNQSSMRTAKLINMQPMPYDCLKTGFLMPKSWNSNRVNDNG